MNEQIKQLAKQAGFYKYGDDFEDIIEKFAELIVLECMRMCEVDWISFVPPAGTSLYTSPPAQRKPLTSQERDAQRWRFLMENSYDSNRVTQFHVWEHSWEPHSQTGEPTEWKQRVRGIALIDFIDRAIEAAHGIKENKA